MTVKQKNFISAVVYVCNVENLIGNFLEMLHSVLDENFEKFEIICVNDASSDECRDKIQQFYRKSEKNCMLSILNMSYCQGVEASMHAGVDLAIGDFVFEFDSAIKDYEPSLIMQTYQRCLQGFDIVSCGKGPERVSSKLFYSIFNKNSGAQYKLQSETFRVISRRAINRVHSMSVNLPYRKALYANCGLKTDYIKYEPTVVATDHNWVLKNPYDTAFTALLLFTNVAYKAALAFTVIMMLATIASIVYVAVVYFTGNPVAGYTTTMLFMSGAFFAMFAILAVIIKYLSAILELVFSKRGYVVESIEKVIG